MQVKLKIMEKKSLTGLLVGILFLSIGCNTRKIDNDTYMSEPGGANKVATAADQAETTSTRMDSSDIIKINGSPKNDSNGL